MQSNSVSSTAASNDDRGYLIIYQNQIQRGIACHNCQKNTQCPPCLKKRRRNKSISSKEMIKSFIPKRKKMIVLLLEVIFPSFSFHFHKTTNHCIIGNFLKQFFLHIANKSIKQMLITNFVRQICLHKLHGRKASFYYCSSHRQHQYKL